MSFLQLSFELRDIILSQALIQPLPIKLAHPTSSTSQTEVMFGPTTPQTAVADFNNLRITCREVYLACSRFFFANNDFEVKTLDHLKHIHRTLPERDLDLITRLCCMRDVWVPTRLLFFTDRPTMREFFRALAHFPNVDKISFILPWQINNPNMAYLAYNPRASYVRFQTFFFELASRLSQSSSIRLLRPEVTSVENSYLLGPRGEIYRDMHTWVLEADQKLEDSLNAWLALSREHRIQATKLLEDGIRLERPLDSDDEDEPSAAT